MKKLSIVTIAIIALITSCIVDPIEKEIQITNPYSNSIWKINSSVDIIWTDNFDDKVNIELWKDAVKVEDIGLNEPSDGIYSWIVKGVAVGNDYSIHIVNTQNQEIYTESEVFEIIVEISSSSFTDYNEEVLNIGDKTLNLYTGGTGDITLIFEHGLGCVDGKYFFANSLLSMFTEYCQFISYDRSGYSTSTWNGDIRGMENISIDLNSIIEQKVTTNKIIGHSWGGFVIRYFAINHPEKISALLFIDPSHEAAGRNKDIMQSEEDGLGQYCSQNNCTGCVIESEQLVETMTLMGSLPNLPNIPVVVLSNTDGSAGAGWVEAHTLLGEDLNDFTQDYCNCGHEIAKAEPELVYNYLYELISKIR